MSPARRRAFLGALDQQLVELEELQAKIQELIAMAETELATREAETNASGEDPTPPAPPAVPPTSGTG